MAGCPTVRSSPDPPAANPLPGAVVTDHTVDEFPALLARDDGLVWVDVPTWDDEAQQVLADIFCFHPLAIKDCIERNQVPKVHVYAGLPVPGAARAGRRQGRPRALHRARPVRRPELPGHGARTDQPRGRPGGDHGRGRVAAAPAGVRAAASRPRPTTCPTRLVSALTGRLRNFTARSDPGRLAARAAGDRRASRRPGAVPGGDVPGQARAAHGEDHGGAEPRGLRADGEDPGLRARPRRSTCSRTPSTSSTGCGRWPHGQKDYLQGTIEFYQARTNTKMTIAAERLAVIAAVTLPITALSSILGMNVIVNDETHYGQLAVALIDHDRDVDHAADLGQAQGLVLIAGRAVRLLMPVAPERWGQSCWAIRRSRSSGPTRTR